MPGFLAFGGINGYVATDHRSDRAWDDAISHVPCS